ncbi:MAG: phosphopentomutase [Candidatus Obscuribacterales bacterium]|jgi:phosphopentomutase|nr:phosphopentomutase [Candidatus Obscuribacterales bacterium]
MGKQSLNERRAIILVVDGCGIGAAPDADKFGDSFSCNTIGNTAKAVGGLRLPNFERLGLGNINSIEGVKTIEKSAGFFGKLKELSAGKDTQTGHWEMMGIVSDCGFPTYPDGFPDELIDQFIKETGCGKVLCNKPASGTQILEDLGEEHQRTGHPIVYTSGDSVWQLACHVDTIPLSKQYEWCQIARNMLNGKYKVGRVIARPFNGKPGSYKRMSFERRDFGVKPPADTFLDEFLASGAGVLGIGKIEDIFDKQGLSHAQHTGTNAEGLELTLKAIKNNYDFTGREIMQKAPDSVRLIFTNLVDTDSLYGHRRNVDGYAGALLEIDKWLGEIVEAMGEQDLLLISSDHGNDPTAPGTDHTREYVPILAYSKSLENLDKAQKDVGIREGFYDMAASLSGWFGMPATHGKSFIPQLTEVA